MAQHVTEEQCWALQNHTVQKKKKIPPKKTNKKRFDITVLVSTAENHCPYKSEADSSLYVLFLCNLSCWELQPLTHYTQDGPCARGAAHVAAAALAARQNGSQQQFAGGLIAILEH